MDTERVSDLLDKVKAGDERAFQDLVCAAYSELRGMAGSLMRGRLDGHTLQPTSLVNEAYLRLVQGDGHWENKAHFFGAAARAMRQVLVAHARQRSAKKRAGNATRVSLDEFEVPAREPDFEVQLLDAALTALAAVDERLVRVLELRYFAGCSLAEVAGMTGRSVATVKRDWLYARAWLHEYMNR